MSARSGTAPDTGWRPPARLTALDWWSLWWQGRTDARRGLPQLPSSAGPQLVLPQVEAIRRQALESCEQERIALAEDLAVLDQRSVRAAHRVQLLERKITTAERELLVLEDQAPAEDERRRGEDDLEPWVVALRRRREQTRRVAAAKAGLEALRTRLQKAEREVEAVEERRTDRRERSAVQVQRTVAHAERRMSLYWRALLRRHPARAELNDRWHLPPVSTPAWAELEDAR